MRSVALIFMLAVGLVAGSSPLSAQALTIKSSLVSRIGSGAARLTTFTSGTGSLYVNLKGLTPGVWNEHLWTGDCVNLGSRVAVLPGLIVAGTGAVARTNALSSSQAKGRTLRLVHGAEVLCTTFGVPSGPAAPTGPTEPATVVRVVDGDTIVINRGWGEERVRYIGIDTPETVHPTEPVEWMGKEASEANRALVEGRQVFIETDVSEVDQYGRLLRYVWVQNGPSWTLVNFMLVAAGFATVSTYPPDVKYANAFLAAQQSARDQMKGLWGTPPPTPTPTPVTSPSLTPRPANCDSSYPTVCIPPPPPDLDCGQIPYRRFTVVGTDPHRFDGDNDGVGCESG